MTAPKSTTEMTDNLQDSSIGDRRSRRVEASLRKFTGFGRRLLRKPRLLDSSDGLPIRQSSIHNDVNVTLRDVPPERGPYQYQALDSSKNEIRLLRLPPCHGIPARERSIGDNIEATLLHVSLEGGPDYEALSYRWGGDNDSAITIDGLSLRIGDTLKCALQGWQSSTEAKLVWVDAICTDQTNDNERNEQVTKMRAIYSNATLVVVWLGRESYSKNSALAFSLVRDLYEHLNEPAYWREAFSDVHRELHWEALRKLMQREYWHRIWVVQGVNFARSLVLRCGSDTI